MGNSPTVKLPALKTLGKEEGEREGEGQATDSDFDLKSISTLFVTFDRYVEEQELQRGLGNLETLNDSFKTSHTDALFVIETKKRNVMVLGISDEDYEYMKHNFVCKSSCITFRLPS